MKLTIEFVESASPNFARVLSICRRLPSFRESTEDGRPLYSVTFTAEEIHSAQAVLNFVHNWKTTAYYIDGILVPLFTMRRLIDDKILRDYLTAKQLDTRRREIEERLAIRKRIRDAKTPRDVIDPNFKGE